MNITQQFSEECRRLVAKAIRLGWFNMHKPLTTRERILAQPGQFTAADISHEGTTRTGVILILANLVSNRKIKKIGKARDKDGYVTTLYEVEKEERPVRHGRIQYQNGCRCEVCVKEALAYQRKWTAAHKKEVAA